MAYSIVNEAGIDFNATYPASSYTIPPFGPLGFECFGSDGRRYVFAQANATIAANTAVCSIDPATFLVTATGGSYKSPATGVVAGDWAWFSAASV